jgi:hypothetical protein
MKQNLKSESEIRGMQYTGFTTKCKKCKQDVNCRYDGKTEEGVPRYILTCGCDEKN